MINPCEDYMASQCTTVKCQVLKGVDFVVSTFFLLEMVVKMLSRCAIGHRLAYLANSWNRLDFAIVAASIAEYFFEAQSSSNWTLIRMFRMLRPLRAIKRIPSLRLLVTLLCDTLPALSSVIALIIFIYFIFGIIGVQLWAGVLRQRCFIDGVANNREDINNAELWASSEESSPPSWLPSSSTPASALYWNFTLKHRAIYNETAIPIFYESPIMEDYVCGGFMQCHEIEHYEKYESMCDNLLFEKKYADDNGTSREVCDQLIATKSYSDCKAGDLNPLKGGISFDNIFVAFITIFQAVSPEGWTEIMYVVQNSYSFWAWPYFVFLIIIVPFGISNLSFIIVAVQIPQTKHQLAKKLKQEREEEELIRRQSSVGNWFSMVNQEMPIAKITSPLLGVKFASIPNNNKEAIKEEGNNNDSRAKFRNNNNLKDDDEQKDSRATVNKNSESNLAKQNVNGINNSRMGIDEADNRNFYTLVVDVAVDTIRQRIVEYKERRLRAAMYRREMSAPPYNLSQRTAAINNAVEGRRNSQLSQLALPVITRDENNSNKIKSGSRCRSCLSSFHYHLNRNRDFWERILAHPATAAFTAAAIVANTITMAVEHHNQPQIVTIVVEVMNFGFTALFTMELILRLYALGFVRYIRDVFNMLDLIIVAISLAELFQGSASRLSVLRTFRLLRIAKLVRFLPTLQEQLLYLFRTINNVAPFLLLLGLFLFLFCVLGMSLFGCKTCINNNNINSNNGDNNGSINKATVTNLDSEQVLADDENATSTTTVSYHYYFIDENFTNSSNSTTTAGAVVDVEPTRQAASPVGALSTAFCLDETKEGEAVMRRFNRFDSLFASLLTVLQVLTQDDGWSQILRDTMFATSAKWPAIYFVVLLMFGNYVILSMLLAIIDVGSSPTAARIIRKQAAAVKFSSLLSLSTSWRSSVLSSSNYGTKLRRQSYSRAMRQPVKLSSSQASSSLNFDCKSVTSYRKAMLHPISMTPIISPRNRRLIKRRLVENIRNISASCETRRRALLRRNDSYEFAIASASREKLEDLLTMAPNDNQMTVPSILLTKADDDNNDNNDRKSLFLRSPAMSGSPNASRLGSHHSRYRRRRVVTISEVALIEPSISVDSDSTSLCLFDGLSLTATSFSNPSSKANSLLPSPMVAPRLTNSRRIANMPKAGSNSLTATTKNETPTRGEPSSKFDDGRGDDVSTVQTSASSMQYKRADYSLFLFPKENNFRLFLQKLIASPAYDNVMLCVVAANCLTVAFERPSIERDSVERHLLDASNYFFSAIFLAEAALKVIAYGFVLGRGSYLHSGWNILDFCLVIVSLIDLGIELGSNAGSTTSRAKVLRALRLLRTFRPLRAINRTPGLKVVIRMLATSVKSIANVVFICTIFFVAFSVLGLQLLRGCYFRCVVADDIEETVNGENQTVSRHLNAATLLRVLDSVKTRDECLAIKGLEWQNQQHNFDNFFESMKSLVVVATFDGWVEITQNGLNCVAVDQQPIENYNPWRLVFFLSFLIIMGFCIVEMLVGVICNNYRHMKGQLVREVDATLNVITMAGHKLEAMSQRLLRRGAVVDSSPAAHWVRYRPWRRRLFHFCNHVYFDLIVALLIVANVLVMAAEFYQMPRELLLAFKMTNYFFTAAFTFEVIIKLVAFGPRHYCRNRWNQLDMAIVALSIGAVFLEEMGTTHLLPTVNPKIIRIIRIIRVVRALKLLKVAKGVQQLLDTVRQALPQVGNLSLLFILVFFVYAILGVELFGRLDCVYKECEGLSRYANFHNFGMALLALFRISTGDKWEEIMQDILALANDPKTVCFGLDHSPLPVTCSSTNSSSLISSDCIDLGTTITHNVNNTVNDELTVETNSGNGTNDCALVTALAPVYFTSFYIITQFFLVNVIVAVLMHHLEEAEKQGLLIPLEEQQQLALKNKITDKPKVSDEHDLYTPDNSVADSDEVLICHDNEDTPYFIFNTIDIVTAGAIDRSFSLLMPPSVSPQLDDCDGSSDDDKPNSNSSYTLSSNNQKNGDDKTNEPKMIKHLTPSSLISDASHGSTNSIASTKRPK